jgi:hypothetical protein
LESQTKESTEGYLEISEIIALRCAKCGNIVAFRIKSDLFENCDVFDYLCYPCFSKTYEGSFKAYSAKWRKEEWGIEE